MKASPILHDLIHSLTEKERNYFIQLSSFQEGDKNYLKIYNLLVETEIYNEDDVKSHFKNESFIKHFPSEKNQLFHQLLKSLRWYQHETIFTENLNERVKNIQLLFNKQLFRHARKELDKIKHDAIQNELYYTLLEIFELEKVLIDIEIRYDASELSILDQLIEEKRKVLSTISSISNYTYIINQLISILKNAGIKNERDSIIINELIAHPSLKQNLIHNSKRETLLYNTAQALAYRLLHKNTEQFNYLTITLNLFEEYKNFISDYIEYYVLCIGFKARIYGLNNQNNKCNELIEKLWLLVDAYKYKELNAFLFLLAKAHINKLMFALFTRNFSLLETSISNTQLSLSKYESKIHKEELSTLHFLIFIWYFGQQDYATSLQWLNKLINESEKNSRQDLYRISLLCNLIVHYELKNISNLNYLLKSNIRYYKKTGLQLDFEKCFMKNFKKITLTNLESDGDKYFERMKKEMLIVFNDPHQKFALEYFDFFAWIYSKQNNCSYFNALKENKNIV
ncbi:MAG: hypothetical protein JSU07_06720 [Bacteroidetes bacterium]|nr:hypothetical protein [Bacteroidota bacterium]